MKKALTLLLAALIITSLFACGSDSDDNPPPQTTAQTTMQTVAATIPYKDIIYPDTLDFNQPEAIAELFWMDDLLPGVTTTVNSKSKNIVQKCTIGDTEFTFSIALSKWAGRTTPEQIVQCARTFWYCYPQMYARFKVKGTPTSIVLKIENEGYEVASTSGNAVHLYDGWLEGSKTDYDCLTHEFAHVVQTNWNGSFVPSSGNDTYMIERFADYCRFIYCYADGKYNDSCWDLQTCKTEDSYAKGVRFWVWLDYTYSTPECDIMQRIAQSIAKKDGTVRTSKWKSAGTAWVPVFEGTGAAGKTLDQLWEEYIATDLAKLSSKRVSKLSPLLKAYPIRETIKGRQNGVDDYLLQ